MIYLLARSTVKTLVLMAVFAAPLSAHAVPILHSLTFQVDHVVDADPRIAVGNVYHGLFSVDSSILAADGLNRGGNLGFLQVQIENFFWCYNVACPTNLFRGFRGPDGLGSASPGFDILNGQIVNVRGGVFGSADFPFIDFSSNILDPSPTPGCTGAYCGNSSNAFFTNNPLGRFGGSMSVARISEPGTIALLSLGLVCLAVVRFRKRPPKLGASGGSHRT